MPPPKQQVQEFAGFARWEMWRQALDAQAVLGEEADTLTLQEANLRVFCHDSLCAHHDRDMRSLVVFPLDILRGIELRV